MESPFIPDKTNTGSTQSCVLPAFEYIRPVKTIYEMSYFLFRLSNIQGQNTAMTLKTAPTTVQNIHKINSQLVFVPMTKPRSPS